METQFSQIITENCIASHGPEGACAIVAKKMVDFYREHILPEMLVGEGYTVDVRIMLIKPDASEG